MEITLISPDCIRIKGKQASLVVNPTASVRTKTPADGIVLLHKHVPHEFGKIEEYRLVVQGAGEYEVGGIKVEAVSVKDDLLYKLSIDGIIILLADATAIGESVEKEEFKMVIVAADRETDLSIITAMTPSVVVLYGQYAQSVAKQLGKDSPASVSKYQTTREKLPAEMEVVVLS